jgi:hypothetical protein
MLKSVGRLSSNYSSLKSVQICDALADHFCSNGGKVPWQNGRIYGST